MKKFTCPYCYGVHTVEKCPITCAYNVPGKTEKCKYSDVTKYFDSTMNIPDRIPQDKISRCLKCDQALTIYCDHINGKKIPTDYLNGQNISIALLGAKASGKSNYIGVLVNEIKKRMTGPFNCSVNTAASDESKRTYDTVYYNQLYVKGELVPATNTAAIPPLIFPLRFMDKKSRIKKTVALSFYDTAGENLDKVDNMLIQNRYIANATGIILLLDPLQVPSIREKLKGKITLPAQNTDTVDILNRVIRIIHDTKKTSGNIKTPIALVFTKIDALQEHGVLPEGGCLNDESEHLKRGVFVKDDFEAVQEEMEAMLDNWLDDEIKQAMNTFTKHAFFGISALGGAPEGPNGKNVPSGGIKPKRALDPLLWLLAESKYISKK